MTETSDFEIVSTQQQRIAELAKQSPQMGFTSLNHHLDLPWLREAYRRTRKDGAVGVDGHTAADYEANLEENLRVLLERAKSGTYFAPPVRRVRMAPAAGRPRRSPPTPTMPPSAQHDLWSWEFPTASCVPVDRAWGSTPGARPADDTSCS